MFGSSKKTAQQAAHQLISGHLSLIAWWTLRHAGVFEAMNHLESEKPGGGGIDPLVFATRTNMSAEVLAALLEYLKTPGLIEYRDTKAFLTPLGRALLVQEDPVLEFVRSYEPVVEAVEHLLAKLKPTTAMHRRAETASQSLANRYAEEVYAAVAKIVSKRELTRLLDVSCGSGDLLIHLATDSKRTVGVGISPDGPLARKANEAMLAKSVDKRLIAVMAFLGEVCTQTKATFERIGVTRTLWQSLDCILAVGAFDASTRDPEPGTPMPTGSGAVKNLAGLATNFPKATLILAEPVASVRLDKMYYAAEYAMLARLTRNSPWPVERWREVLTMGGYVVEEEIALNVEGVTVFVAKPKRGS